MLFKRPQGVESFLAGMQHLHNFYCLNIYTPQPTVNLLPEAGGKKMIRIAQTPGISARRNKGPSQRA